MNITEIRAAARTAVPPGYKIGAVDAFDDRHHWADVLFGNGDPISRVEAPDNAPVLLVNSETGETHWLDCAQGQAVPSPLE